MPEFKADRRVAVAPEAIFARITDLGALAERSKRVTAVERLDAEAGTPAVTGARWRIDGDFGPFANAAEVEMVEFAVGEAVAFQTLTRGWSTTLRLALTEREAAACRLTAHWRLDPVGMAAMRAAPAIGMFAPMMQAGLARALKKVAAAFEEG
jgi:hypothetical protein